MEQTGEDPPGETEELDVRNKVAPHAPPAWWTRPTMVTLLTGLIAAIAPATTAIYTSISSSGRLQLEERKQVHEMRQEYLNRVLNEKQSKRVLQFLVFVEEDVRLRDWAIEELRKTETRIQENYISKEELYTETIQLVSRLASLDSAIVADSRDYKRFWELYRGELISVESRKVEGLMVTIGGELKSLLKSSARPNQTLKDLSFKLALTMKRELREDALD